MRAIYCRRKDKVDIYILQFGAFAIKYTEMGSNLVFLNKTVALTHTLYIKSLANFIQKYQITTHFSILYCKIAKL